MEDEDDLDLIFPDGDASSPGSSTGDTTILKDAEVHALSFLQKEEEGLESPWPSPLGPDPMKVIKMMAELTLAKEKFKKEQPS